MLQHVEGIVLKTQNYGETHKILTLFTKDFGLISGLSRGANKPKSKLVAVSQPFIQAKYLMYVNKGLSTIQQGEVTQANRNIREDIFKTAYASYISELTYKLLEQKQPEYYFYSEFIQTISYINKNDMYQIPVMMYELKLYKKNGFAPVIQYCSTCHQKKNHYYYSVQEGGLICDECRHLDNYSISIPQVFVKFFDVFINESISKVEGISVKEENIQLLRSILDQHYERFGGFKIKSKRFLDQMNKLHMTFDDK